MQCHRQRRPVRPNAGLGLHSLSSALHETSEVAHLHLEEGKIARDLRAVGLEAQGEPVGLDRFLVVAHPAVQQAVDVPADMGLHGVAEGELAQLECFGFLALAAEHEGLHGLGVAMVGHLAQDLIGALDAFLVLLGLVILDEMAEERLLLGRQRLRHGRWENMGEEEEEGEG